LGVLVGQPAEFIMTSQELVSRSQHPADLQTSVYGLKLTQP
jgi:hypothetical protein